MKHRHHCCILFILPLLLTASAATLRAETQKLRASLSHYDTESGLSSNSIGYIAQDDYGYVWIATWNGLTRFDGYSFYNYRTGNGSHIPHMHNRIQDLVIDGAQNVWLRMYDGRIFVVNRTSDLIVSPFQDVSGGEDFITEYPLMATSNGDVLASIKDVGLYILRLDRNGIHSQMVSAHKYVITSMVEGYQNDIWLGTNHGVHRLDIGNLSIESNAIFPDENITCLHSNGYNIYGGTVSGKIIFFAYGQEPRVLREGGERITSLMVDSHDMVWFNDVRSGSSRLNPQTGDVKHFSQVVPIPQYDGHGGKFREAAGYVWVRMNHGGYGYYDREADQVEYFHNDPVNPWNLNNTVNAALELDEGVIWESTARKGLEKLELLKNTIERRLLVQETNNRDENETRAIYFDSHARLLLIGNKAGTLFLYRDGQLVTKITHDSQGRPFGRFYGISKSNDGAYLLCSKDHGLFVMQASGPDKWHISNICHVDGQNNSLNSDAAYDAVQDREGNIWVATYGGGVNVLTQVTGKDGRIDLSHPLILHPDNAMRDYPFNGFRKVRAIEMDRDGTIWAGTTDGILTMDLSKGKLRIQRLENSEQQPDDILMSNDVVCLTRDAKGTMWLGTNGGGLSCVKGRDSDGRYVFDNFCASDGLPSEEIRSITFDEQGKVWFTTDNIICSMETKRRILSAYTQLDGVDDTQISEGAMVSMPDGEILVGTLEGYYVVDRRKLVSNSGTSLKLRITDFFINDQLQSPRLTDTYDYYVPDARGVRLPVEANVVAFRFASLNYQLQHRVHYQYMLEGYDRNWRNADRKRTAVYGNLPFGTYHFKVKAFLLENPEKYDLRTLEVIVPPPFLLSTGAIWLYLISLVSLALYLMFRHQNNLWSKAHPGENLSFWGKPIGKTNDSDAGTSSNHQEEELVDDYEVMSDGDVIVEE